MTPPFIDQKARDMARDAAQMISTHVEVCEEQNRNIIATIGSIKEGMEGLYSRFWVAACSLIALLVGILVKLVFFAKFAV